MELQTKAFIVLLLLTLSSFHRTLVFTEGVECASADFVSVDWGLGPTPVRYRNNLVGSLFESK